MIFVEMSFYSDITANSNKQSSIV